MGKVKNFEKRLAIASDVEIAQKVIETSTQPLKAWGNEFFAYNSKIWEPIKPSDISLMVQRLDGRAQAINGKERVFRVQAHTISGVKRIMYDRLFDENFARQRKPGLCFNNGFLAIDDTGTANLIPHSMDQNAVDQSPYDYDTNAPRDVWVDQLKRVWADCDDVEGRISCLQELIGLALLGKGTKHTKCIIFAGEGSNGKSVIIDTLQMLFPKNAVTRVVPQNWGDKNYLALLKYSRINISSELPRRQIAESDLFKAVVDGETVQVHEKYEKGFGFEPQAFHLFAANELPETHDQTAGFWRRFIVISFPVTFSGNTTKQEVVNKLAVQIQGIMAWAIEGACRALAGGTITIPTSSVQRTQEWKSESDQTAMFVSSCCVDTGRTDEVKSEELYPAFQEWCRVTGHTKPMTQQTFQKKLGQMGMNRMVTQGELKGRKRTTLHLLPRSKWQCRAKQNNELGYESWELGIPRVLPKCANVVELNPAVKASEVPSAHVASTSNDEQNQ